MGGVALAVVGELGGEDGLNVLGLGGEDDVVAEDGGGDGVVACAGEVLHPAFFAEVFFVLVEAVYDEVDAWGGGGGAVRLWVVRWGEVR